MKKLLYSSLVLGLALCFSSALRAQNMYDALNFSTNEYFGTARSMALGNAVTAIGGDLGTIGINPAGSAVASYSQLTFTPGLNISIVNSSFDNGQGNNVPSGNVRDKGFVIPNFGASIVFDTGNRGPCAPLAECAGRLAYTVRLHRSIRQERDICRPS